jgi:hypothetical protein
MEKRREGVMAERIRIAPSPRDRWPVRECVATEARGAW